MSEFFFYTNNNSRKYQNSQESNLGYSNFHHNYRPPQERKLKELLRQGQLSEAISFLERSWVRRETALKVFAKLTSNFGEVAA